MLRSKMHRPWQPRVSGSQLFNPSAHTTESDATFSDGIEEVEREVHEPAESRDPATAIETIGATDDMEPTSAAAESPTGIARWYASLFGRRTRH